MVPSDILDRVITKEPTPTRVSGRVTQLQSSKDNLIIPKVNYFTDDLYTTGMRVTWTGEVPASSTAMRVTDPVFGQTHIPVYTAMMSIPVTNDMIEDASFPLVSWLSSKFGETRDLLMDNMILNGSGVGQPAGILLNPGADNSQPAVLNSGQAASLGSSDTAAAKFLVKISMTVPEQYQPNCVWVMNLTNTANTIAQFQDANGRPLWGAGVMDAGLQEGYLNRRLVGREVVYSGFMPNIGTSTYPLIFGDLSAYYLVNRVGFSIQVLRELYAETNQVLVLGRMRFGGQITEPWKVKIGYCHT